MVCTELVHFIGTQEVSMDLQFLEQLTTVIYKKEGFQRLKIFFIVLFYIVLAMVILFTSGIENIPEPWRAIIGISIMTIMGVLIVLTIFKLNLLYVDVEDNDIWLK